MRSSLLTLDLKESKLQDSGKEEEGKMSNELHVLGINDDFWDKVRGLGSETWKGCDCVELLVVLTRLRGTGIISLIS